MVQSVFTCKFGGTSLATGERVAKVAELIKSDPRRRYIVVSAPGKAPERQTKVTDLLYAVHENKRLGLDFQAANREAMRPFEEIAFYLDALRGGFGSVEIEFENALREHFQIVQERDVSRDYVASRGEYLMARLLAIYLDWPFVDAEDIVRFTSQGVFDPVLTQELMSEELEKYSKAVIPGFYGSTPEGYIKTFSRGGSDLTGAIVARATQSDLYENWTDVDGMMSADPRIVADAKPINQVTYRELRELSYMGASVFHEEAVAPARMGDVPIHIRNTFNTDALGTIIMHESRRIAHPVVVGVAGHKGFSTINLRKMGMNEERGFLRRFLSVLEDEGLNVEHVPGGIDTLSVIVPSEQLYDSESHLEQEIRLYCHPDEVVIDHGLALVATVGHGMKDTVGVAARLTGALARDGVNIKMLNQGASELSIIVGVAEQDYERAICAIHKEFFSV